MWISLSRFAVIWKLWQEFWIESCCTRFRIRQSVYRLQGCSDLSHLSGDVAEHPEACRRQEDLG